MTAGALGAAPRSVLEAARLLLRLDASRAASALRRPVAGVWVGGGLPLAAAASALWIAGTVAAPRVDGAADGATLGLLLGAPLSLAAYGVLLRGKDEPLLRRLGLPLRAVFVERAARLLLLAVGLALLSLLPFAAAGEGVARPLAVALAAALASWGAAAGVFALAALALAGHRPGERWGCLASGMWDRELAAVAPLVYAPLAPLLAGAVAGGVVGGAPGAGWVRLLGAAVVAVAATLGAAGAYDRAAPRFAPQALEMGFAPAAAGRGEALRIGHGAARLLPRRAAAAWARDARVAARRFGWATRMVWPVAVLSMIALARWGRLPATRGWVVAAALAVWVAQAVAVIGLGRLERGGPRWVDRGLGITPAARLLGRWAFAWGMALWLGVPLALGWGWWAEAGSGWGWIAAPAVTAAVAAVASTAAAGWR